MSGTRNVVVAGVSTLAWVGLAQASTLHVPSEYPTINSAMDSAVSGDSVLVAPGVYDDWETRIVVVAHTSSAFLRDGVTLLSESGPGQTILRVDGPSSSATESVIHVGGLPSSETVIEGFEITGTMEGLVGIWGQDSGTVTVRDCRFVDLDTGRHVGGGIWAMDLDLDLVGCDFIRCTTTGQGGGMNLSDVRLTANACSFEECADEAIRLDGVGPTGGASRIEDCVFRDNGGTALVVRSTPASIVDCTFVDNVATVSSGAIVVGSAGVSVNVRGCLFSGNIAGTSGAGAITTSGRGAITGNTFVGNEGPSISAILLSSDTLLFFTKNVLVGNTGSPAVMGRAPLPRTGCNLFWNNPDGNASGYTIQPTSILADPQFCDPDNGDFTVQSTSPCLPDSSGGCDLIGAFGEGCGSTSIRQTSWGRIKGLYRE